MDNSRPVLQPGCCLIYQQALARHWQQICITTASSGRKKWKNDIPQGTSLRWKKKKNGSSFCFKSSRVEINHVRKIPLKHPSQTSTDHSGIYLSLAIYFLSPQKQSATSALFHHSTAPCTGQLWRTAVEEEMHSWCAQVMEPSAGTCKEEHPPHWHVNGTEQPGKR